jgi:hypothetical protein
MEHNDNDNLPQENVSYEIFAQNSTGRLMIKNVKENNFLIRTPDEIIKDKDLLEGFSNTCMEWIKTIDTLNQKTENTIQEMEERRERIK